MEFKVIPGYEGYEVSSCGVIRSISRNIELSQYLFNGYLIVDAFYDAKTETLPVHRAVALAWVENKDVSKFDVVNHLDGDPLNNQAHNLEWTDASGNNYHAINTGLRSDNICCRVRDFVTGEVSAFSSLAQASEFMGLPKDTQFASLFPRRFGKLVKGRYEVKFEADKTPWFYEGKAEIIKPTQFIIVIDKPDGSTQELYSKKSLLKEYQLYKHPTRSIPGLVAAAESENPDLKFTVRDCMQEEQFRVTRNTQPSIRQEVTAFFREARLIFKSLTACAEHFGVDRSSILNRISNGKDLDGWTFATNELPA